MKDHYYPNSVITLIGRSLTPTSAVVQLSMCLNDKCKPSRVAIQYFLCVWMIDNATNEIDIQYHILTYARFREHVGSCSSYSCSV